MKKIIKIVVLSLSIISLSGCIKRDNLEDINIHTTVYPIEYLVERIYGNNSTVYSIYPNEIDVIDYELSKKQKESISESPIFVYNGLTDEKEVAKDILNLNDELLIIDVSYGLKYKYSIEELWLSPDNYLMLATNIKNSLDEFIVNKVVKEEISDNFEILEEELSLMDADIRSIANKAIESNNHTLVAVGSLFNFLENYEFDVIDLTDETVDIDDVIEEFDNEVFDTIYVRDDMEISEEIQSIIDTYEVNVVIVDVMSVLDEEQRDNKSDYLTIMSSFVEELRNNTNS